MKRILAPMISIALVGTFAGCDKDNSATTKPAAPAAPQVGIVDIDRVAKQMGWADEMQKNLQESDAQAKKQIESRMQLVQAAVDQKKKEIETSANLTADQITALNAAKDRGDLEKLGLNAKQIDDLVQISYAVQGEKNQVANAYQQFMQQRLAAIRGAYRDALNPVVRRVAAANDRTCILTPSDNLIYFDPANDLTDKVIDDLQKSPPLKVNLPEIPHAPTTAPATQP